MMDAIGSNHHRHCERSEAIQGTSGALRLLDRRVAIAGPVGRASFDALRLLAMTIPSERVVLQSVLPLARMRAGTPGAGDCVPRRGRWGSVMPSPPNRSGNGASDRWARLSLDKTRNLRYTYFGWRNRRAWRRPDAAV
jgi:YD repeat-containing protein